MTRAILAVLWAGIRLAQAPLLPWGDVGSAYERLDAALDHLLWLRWVQEHPEDA